MASLYLCAPASHFEKFRTACYAWRLIIDTHVEWRLISGGSLSGETTLAADSIGNAVLSAIFCGWSLHWKLWGSSASRFSRSVNRRPSPDPRGYIWDRIRFWRLFGFIFLLAGLAALTAWRMESGDASGALVAAGGVHLQSAPVPGGNRGGRGRYLLLRAESRGRPTALIANTSRSQGEGTSKWSGTIFIVGPACLGCLRSQLHPPLDRRQGNAPDPFRSSFLDHAGLRRLRLHSVP